MASPYILREEALSDIGRALRDVSSLMLGHSLARSAAYARSGLANVAETLDAEACRRERLRRTLFSCPQSRFFA